MSTAIENVSNSCVSVRPMNSKTADVGSFIPGIVELISVTLVANMMSRDPLGGGVNTLSCSFDGN